MATLIRQTQVILFIVALCAAAAAQNTCGAPEVFRLDAALQDSVVQAPEGFAAHAARYTHTVFPLPGWTTAPEAAPLDCGQGPLGISLTPESALDSPTPLNIDASALGLALLELSVEGTASIRLWWRLAGSAWDDPGAGVYCTLVNVPKTNASVRYKVRVPDDLRMRDLKLDQLRLTADGGGTISLQRLEVWETGRLFTETAFGTISCTLGEETRPCLYGSVPGHIRVPLQLPDAPLFRAGLGCANSDAPVTMRVSLVEDDLTRELARHDVAPGAQWNDISINLATHAKRGAVLELAAEGPHGAVALWSNPAVCSAARGMSRAPNFVVYVVDALRTDRLGCYGRSGALTPNIDALAARGTAFLACFSNETSTGPSMASLATGVDALAHGHGSADGVALAPGLVTFPELLRAAGWTTCALSENPFTPPSAASGRAYSIQRFFDEHSAGRTGETQAAAAEFIRKHREQPFFLYVHTMECHAGLHRDVQTPAEASPYDESVALADRNFGRLVEMLEQEEMLGNTLIVFTADHGEALGERGDWGHGYEPYTEQIHVPLILAGPGPWGTGSHSPTPVQLTDIAPTVLRAAGLPQPGHYQGLPLQTVMEDDPRLDRVLFSSQGQTSRSRAAIQPPWKLWRTRNAPDRLVDFTADPAETGSRSDKAPAVFETLRRALDEHENRQRALFSRMYQRSDAVIEAEVNPARIEAMEALGYLD